MKILIWNIRRVGKPARIRQFKEIIARERVEMVGVQETIKQTFTAADMAKIDPGGCLTWNWVPARGHSGGILVGVKEDNLQVENWETGTYYLGVTVRDRKTNFRWDMIVAYGPAQHEKSPKFINELSDRCNIATLPTCIGGDVTP